MGVTDEDRRQLEERGFVVLERFMDDEMLDGLRTRVEAVFAEEGERAGWEFKPESGCDRLANLVNKGEIFRRAIALPALLEYVRCVLGTSFKLSSMNARRVPPQCDTVQPLHADMAAVADERGYWVCNTVWLLDEFTEVNGPLRVVPGSHRWGMLPADVLDDPFAAHPEETLVTGPAGSVVVLNAHVWHGGLANHTDAARTAVHAFYCRRDKPQQQHQKQLLSAAVQRELSPELRGLLALDDAENDRLSAHVEVRSGLSTGPGARSAKGTVSP